MQTFFVTGVAGFIGNQVAIQLLERGDRVVGLDNLNDYYSVTLKRDRLRRIDGRAGFTFVQADLNDYATLERLFQEHSFDRVIHLAAQAGVRYSLTNPRAYIEANICGFMNILEVCRHARTPHLAYASSSSVYGANTSIPFSVHDNVDHPVSLYAATKKSNELMAHTYSHLFNLPTTGLRFFTVYGPWGRPDMALFKFTEAILANRPIDVYNHGKMKRDFTYIDDIVEGVIRVTDQIATPNAQWTGQSPDPATSSAPYRVFNIGNNQPVELSYFIEVLERALGRVATKNYLPLQDGDVPQTFANIDALETAVQYRPSTSIETGIERFVAWYRSYHGKKQLTKEKPLGVAKQSPKTRGLDDSRGTGQTSVPGA